VLSFETRRLMSHADRKRSRAVLGRSVPEIFRMLVCLEERGYISRMGPDERYQLTLKLFEIVHQHRPLQRLINQARPLVQRVASETGQSCHLAMLNSAEVVIVAEADAPGNMGFSVRPGANIDLLNTASGHVILAFQTDEVRSRALGAWRLRSGKPIPASLYRHLHQIRRRGYEELASYQVHGIVNISYPILNQHGEAIAAMTIPFLARIGDSPRAASGEATTPSGLANAIAHDWRQGDGTFGGNGTSMTQTEYFEDYVVGAQGITSGRTITETDVVIHAGHTGDYFPHHVDAEFARQTPFGQRVAHGTMTFAIGIGLTASQINPVAFTYGYDRLRFPKPVFIGDTLRTRVTVKEKQDDPKRKALGRVVGRGV
jgi:DNA-binding IclR family transcriptional regulator/acyl dehydratase